MEPVFVLSIDQIAQLTHNLNRDLCWITGDFSQPPFDEAPDWQVQSAMNGVIFRLKNPGVTPEQMHQNWMKVKLADGWVYGPVKDSTQKTHPCLLDYSQLGPEQRIKDYLFSAVVSAVVEAGAAPELP